MGCWGCPALPHRTPLGALARPAPLGAEKMHLPAVLAAVTPSWAAGLSLAQPTDRNVSPVACQHWGRLGLNEVIEFNKDGLFLWAGISAPCWHLQPHPRQLPATTESPCSPLAPGICSSCPCCEAAEEQHWQTRQSVSLQFLSSVAESPQLKNKLLLVRLFTLQDKPQILAVPCGTVVRW